MCTDEASCREVLALGVEGRLPFGLPDHGVPVSGGHNERRRTGCRRGLKLGWLVEATLKRVGVRGSQRDAIAGDVDSDRLDWRLCRRELG